MKRPPLHRYKSYRQLLDGLLTANKLSYRGFANRSHNLVSFPTLAKVLTKDPKGQYKQNQNLSSEKLTLLLRFFGYSREEIRYALLLRFENDCQVLPQSGGSLCKLILSHLVEEEAEHQSLGGPTKKKKDKPLSSTAQKIGYCYDRLPEVFKKRFLKSLLQELDIILERQRYFPGVIQLRNCIKALKTKT